MDFVPEIKVNFPQVNLGSASIVNKQSIEDSLKSKASSIDILNFESIDFIAAEGLSINDVKTYKSLGYKAIIIGDKGFKNKKFDPKICEWLKNNNNN